MTLFDKNETIVSNKKRYGKTMRFHSNIIKECFHSWVHLTILKTLMRQPKAMSQRQLARIMGIPWVTVHRALTDLGETGLVKSTRIGTAIYWDFDRKGYLYETLLPILEGLGKITPPLKALEIIIRKTLPLPRSYRMILFGSTVAGTDTPTSDIDLCIIFPGSRKTLPPSVQEGVNRLQETCLEKFGKVLNAIFLPTNILLKNPHKELHRNILKGLEIKP